MKTYYAIFKVRFIEGFQYRAAAYAGVATQFAWGFMEILLYKAFYTSNPDAFPMDFSAFCSYIWLQQATMAIWAPYRYLGDISDMITKGTIAYELARPVNLYFSWFSQNVAKRLSDSFMRFVPIVIVALILPEPYNISLPGSPLQLLLCFISLSFGCIVMISMLMMIYISQFYTTSSMGIRILFMTLSDFLSGSLIPIPFFPAELQRLVYSLPFASVQSTPFLIYTGYFDIERVVYSLLMQLIWGTVLIASGYLLMKKTLKRVVVNGG